MKTLRLILGDQLNHEHSWFDKKSNDVLYVMAEMRQETDYVKHHIQKVVAFFLSMRNFASHLTDNGHQVRYYKISDKDNSNELTALLSNLISKENSNWAQYIKHKKEKQNG